jgi:hypothetical protein
MEPRPRVHANNAVWYAFAGHLPTFGACPKYRWYDFPNTFVFVIVQPLSFSSLIRLCGQTVRASMIISKAVTPFLRLSNRSTVAIWFMSHLKKEPLASLPTGIGCIP